MTALLTTADGPMQEDRFQQSCGPLTAEEYREFMAATQRARKLRRLAKVASFNGWSTAVFAVCCLLFAPFSFTALVLGAGLGVVAANELRGRKRLNRFEPDAPQALGWNQLALLVLLISYAAWSIHATLSAPSPTDAYAQSVPEVGQMLGSLDRLHTTLSLAVYGLLIAGSVVVQGLTATYYFCHAKTLRKYLDETPSWIVQLQRAVLN